MFRVVSRVGVQYGCPQDYTVAFADGALAAGEFLDLKLVADWCDKAGLQLIQILPINDSGEVCARRDVRTATPSKQSVPPPARPRGRVACGPSRLVASGVPGALAAGMHM